MDSLLKEQLENEIVACGPEKTSGEQEILEVSKKGAVYLFTISSQSRFTLWLNALKIRYWVDFGNQDDYRVEWIRKTGPSEDSKDIVEVIIQLYRIQDGDSVESLLFTITVYVTKQKVMVQGKHREFWKETEFSRLRDFVNLLSTDDVLDNEHIGPAYTEVFQDKENMRVLDLNGVSLDVLSDCDDEVVDEEEQDIDLEDLEEPLTTTNKSSKTRYPRRTRLISSRKSHAAVSSAKKLPEKAPTVEIAQQKILESVQLCLKRVSEIEDVVARVDRLATESDLKLSSNDSMANRVKHEMTVLKNTHESLSNEYQERLVKAEAEIKKMQGRLGSLVEEKANLAKKVRALEDTNSALQNRITELERNHADERREEISRTNALVQTEEPIQESIDDDRADIEPDDSQNVSPGSQRVQRDKPPQEYDFVFLCDSNRKFIDTKKLCPQSNVKVIPCGNTAKATEILNSPRFLVRKGLVINTGVNDVESLDVEDVIEKQVEMVRVAVNAFPDRKLIISNITPRDDNLDKAVIDVNDAVHRRINNLSNVTCVDNSNLRDRKLFFDSKHLNRTYGVSAFAANLKRGIRTAFGIRLSDRRPQTRPYDRPNPSRHEYVSRPPRLIEERQQASRHPPDLPSQGTDMSAVTSQLRGLTELITRLVQVSQVQQRVVFPPPVPPGAPGLAFCNPNLFSTNN